MQLHRGVTVELRQPVVLFDHNRGWRLEARNSLGSDMVG